MIKLEEIFDEESQEKAYLIYALVALKMTRKIQHQLPENVQQIVDDATTYWTNNADQLVTKEQMNEHASVISKLRFKSPKRYEMTDHIELKVVELCLSVNINADYFDYHLDWMYEVGRKIGFSNQKLDQLIDETIEEVNT